MTDPIKDIQARIAYKVWETRGGESEANWNYAGKIIQHFLDRRSEEEWWQTEHEDFEMWEKYIYD